MRDCSFVEKCGQGCQRTIQAEYPCVVIRTDMRDNGTQHQPTLYHSYAVAKQTEFKCSLYECHRETNIFSHAQKMKKKRTTECYYRPGIADYVYIESGNWNCILTEFILLIIFTVIGGLFDLVLGVIIIIVIIGSAGFVVVTALDFIFHCNLRERCSKMSLNNLRIYLCFKCVGKETREKSMINAVECGDLRTVKKIAAKKVNMIHQQTRYKPKKLYPISIAAKKGQHHIVEFLLLNDIKTNAQYRHLLCEKTVLKYACDTGNAELIELFIKDGYLGYSDSAGGVPIVVTLLQKGYLDCLRLLISAGYPLHKETEAICKCLSDIKDKTVYGYMIHELENTASLQRLCRTSIRAQCSGKHFQKKLRMLGVAQGGPLPEIMVAYLLLENETTKCMFSVENEDHETTA